MSTYLCNSVNGLSIPMGLVPGHLEKVSIYGVNEKDVIDGIKDNDFISAIADENLANLLSQRLGLEIAVHHSNETWLEKGDRVIFVITQPNTESIHYCYMIL